MTNTAVRPAAARTVTVASCDRSTFEPGETVAHIEKADMLAWSDAISFTPLDVTVDGTDVGLLAGPGWTYDADAKQLTLSADCTLSGSNTVGAVSVLVSADCVVTLSNLCLRCSDGYTAYAPVLLDSNVAATLVLAGDNTLRAVQPRAAIGVPPGTSLTVIGDGRLDAAGGYMGAGIGGWLTTGCGTVSIEGGIITLGRGTEAACIGGGSYGAGGDVAISGGTILLREYTSAPIPNSIGRGRSSTGSDGSLTITGGSLGELGSFGTRALDLSLLGSAPTNAAGETLSSVAITNLAPNAPVAFNGLPAYYGTDGIVADANGNIFLWLPDGDWSGIVTDIAYPSYLAGADDTVKTNWVDWARKYGANTNAEYAAAFLLDVAPAELSACTGALLRVSAFAPAAAGWRLELASDLPGHSLFQPASLEGTCYLCNGILVLETASDLSAIGRDALVASAPSAETGPALPNLVRAAATIEDGRAVVDYDSGDAPPAALFLRPRLAPAEPPVRLAGDHAPEGYSLAWNDEFDSEERFYGGWTFEKGGAGWGNDELQYYCAGGVFARTGQRTASVGDGTLKIRAYKVEPSEDSANREYVSARLNTTNSWQYGYIEMRARLPTTAGCWPAFWMLLRDGPSYVRDESRTGGEIDILEYVPGDPWYQPDALNAIYFSAHSYDATREAGRDTGYTDPATGVKHSYCQEGRVDTPGEWHCYGMEWTHECIRGYLDGVEYFYVPNPTPDAPNPAAWPFDQRYYLKLNLAIGGWGGDPAEEFGEPTYEIDWVRVYQRQPAR